ncbi:MAG: cytochrome c3 family protein [Gammaproteobacteria bacterium]
MTPYLRFCCLVLAWLLLAGGAAAQRVSDIARTKHNLSVSGTGTVKSTSEDQVCVFCHTPHGATSNPGAPLWNRQLSNQTYTTYTSASLDAGTIRGQLDQPGGSSKICLSCHDGTLAIGAVNVLGGKQNVTIPMTGTAAGGTMPPGAGTQTGFTRDLGIDLSNDHPISFTYDSALASADGELVDPANAAHIGIPRPGVRPPVPLEPTGAGGGAQLQCGSCHDPHVHDIDLSKNIKFLRLSRFQETPPGGGSFDQNRDIVCLACHDKAGWATSAHASSSAANETYTAAGANLRELPSGLPVWQASCLNCHDTHTVHGARRLLREGTDSAATPKSGGATAIEETCYQCHSPNPVVNNPGGEVPDIKTDFNQPRHMPITSSDQAAGVEVHDITNADFSETQALLGKSDLQNRHAECTDCHNPHRAMKNQVFNGTGASTEGTHNHTGAHSNIASGVLRGAWGVEPLYGDPAFLALPSSLPRQERRPWHRRQHQCQ